MTIFEPGKSISYIIDKFGEEATSIRDERAKCYSLIVSEETSYLNDLDFKTESNSIISRDIENCIDSLSSKDIIEINESTTLGGYSRTHYSLNSKGKRKVEQISESQKNEIDDALKDWRDYPLSNLIEDSKTKYFHDYNL